MIHDLDAEQLIILGAWALGLAIVSAPFFGKSGWVTVFYDWTDFWQTAAVPVATILSLLVAESITPSHRSVFEYDTAYPIFAIGGTLSLAFLIKSTKTSLQRNNTVFWALYAIIVKLMWVAIVFLILCYCLLKYLYSTKRSLSFSTLIIGLPFLYWLTTALIKNTDAFEGWKSILARK